MVRLSPVDAPHLIWPVAEVALQRVKDKTGEPWTTSYVLAQINSGDAKLFRFTNDGDHVAWVVVERKVQGTIWMNVWIVEGAGLQEHGVECMALIDQLALRIGASRWRCGGRKGWGKALGLKPIATVYERTLT